MARGEGACLVCGKSLVYTEKAEKLECQMCHQIFESYACCEYGHYVCDGCHEKKGVEVIMEETGKTTSVNPIEIMQEIMENPYIYMHGPEHHILVGAALLAAYKNAGGKVDSFEDALEEMRHRGSEYPGGACGMWGCCGAAVSTGIFMSIILKATPLTGKSWGRANCMTARALEAIGEAGGPRCCKRDSFKAVTEAVNFVEKELGVKMELPEKICCTFSDENAQCLKARCPYYKNYESTKYGAIRKVSSDPALLQ